MKFGSFPLSSISKMWKARKRALLPILEATLFFDSPLVSTQELAQAFPFSFASFLCVSYGSRKNGTAGESLPFCHKDKWIQRNIDSKNKHAAYKVKKETHYIQKKYALRMECRTIQGWWLVGCTQLLLPIVDTGWASYFSWCVVIYWNSR